AKASSPSSTLRRTTSKKLASVKKFSPIAAKIASSTAKASASTHSPLGKQISRQLLRSLSMLTRPHAHGIHRYRCQNDAAFDGALPICAEAQECERGADHAQKQESEQRPPDRTAPPGDGDPAHHRGGDHLKFQPNARIAGNLLKAYRVEHGG